VSSPFLAEIRIFPFNFAPTGWAFCNGQLLPISQNTALFSLLGTTFGGDGKSNFALPNLQGRVPLGPGQGPGLSPYNLGDAGGEVTVTLLASQMPVHTHAMQVAAQEGALNNPGPQNALSRSHPGYNYTTPASAGTLTTLAGGAVGVSGSSQPHNNLMPYLTLNFCIALVGVFPPRS
jgi:microcystin-dependent protein